MIIRCLGGAGAGGLYLVATGGQAPRGGGRPCCLNKATLKSPWGGDGARGGIFIPGIGVVDAPMKFLSGLPGRV